MKLRLQSGPDAGRRSQASLLVLALLLSGCGTVPYDGPLASQVVADSDNKAKSSTNADPDQKYLYDIVDVDQNVASIVSGYRDDAFQRRFGASNGAVNPTIGVGDTLNITIFEAGSDGLFSTQESKATSIPVTVQPDGKASVPYIGQVQFAGRTIEAARNSIVAALKTRAVEPDVSIVMAENASRTVAVNGFVGRPAVVPLGLRPEKVTDVIAKAGGPVKPSYETFITLTRNGRTAKALLERIVENPREDVYTRPGDQIFVSHEPLTFSILGQTGQSAKLPLGAESVNIIEATAMASGAKLETSDPKGFFVFRFEHASVLKRVLGTERFEELRRKGMGSKDGELYPIVYRIDLSRPGSYLLGQSFPIRDKDVVYLARHPTNDIIRFISLLSGPVSIVRAVTTL
jgi:polysaccharide export outer membrane protein